MNLFDLPRKPSLTESYLLPLVGLALIITADHSVHSVLLTPMLSICLLGVLAFRLETKALTFWLVIFTCNVILSLTLNGGTKPGTDLNVETIVVRSFGFLVSGSIAVAMNLGRSKLIQNHRLLLEILKVLPCGVVVSDSSSTLLFANKKASIVLGKPSESVIGRSFFSFTSPEQRGQDIQNYLHLSEQELPKETTLTIVTDSNERQNVRAAQIPMNLIGQKCVVTVIELDPSSSEQKSDRSSGSSPSRR